MYMQLLKQARIEDLSNELAMYATDEMLERFEKEGIITKVKKKRKDDCDFSTLRLSKKGADILENVEVPEVTQGELDLFEYLKTQYLSENEERKIGSDKKVKQYIAILRNELSLNLHQMYWFLYLYIGQENYSYVLEYLFLNPNKQRYLKFKDHVSESRVYQYWRDHQTEIQQFFKTKGV